MLNVYAHEPLTASGWELVEMRATPDEAANVMRAWAAKGWRVMAVSYEFDPNSGEWSN